MTRSRTTLPFALLASLSLTPSARADEPSADNARARADDEFNEGKRLMDAGRTEAACAKFAHSQELDPKLGRLLNLAFCHEKEGKTASSWSEYNGAAALAEQKGQDERVQFAREHAAAVAKKLSFVHLEVSATATVVEVDGAGLSRERWPTPLPFDPGEHRVVASAPGKKPRSMVLVVGSTPGIQDFRIDALEDDSAAPARPVGPVPSPPPVEPESAAPHPQRPSHVPAFIATGVAAAGFGVGVAFGLEAMSKKSAADRYCPNKLCDPAGRALISDAQSAATFSTIGFGAGVAGAAAATWLFIRPPGSETASARLIPLVGMGGPRSAGLALRGAW
jgi:hypothetical protein